MGQEGRVDTEEGMGDRLAQTNSYQNASCSNAEVDRRTPQHPHFTEADEPDGSISAISPLSAVWTLDMVLICITISAPI